MASGRLQSSARPNPDLASVRALVFDTFGTVVDWRTSVTREVEELARRKGLTVDGAKFADAWRAGYGPSMNRVRRGELPWTKLDRLHHHYKPDPEVYQSAADILDLKPADVMMVAAHLGDLRAAKDVGLTTAFVTRPLEFGPNGKPDLKADSSVDLTAKDFNDLAGQLGV
jgi:FMN phosphatase YigB (HAD superfamily)